MDKEEKFRIVDDQVRGELAAAQEWICGTCGGDLVAGAVTVVFASPAEGDPAYRAPVLVNESCADEQRASFPNFADARKTLGRAGDPEAAELALQAAVGLHRDRVNAVVEQAVRPLQGEIEGLQTRSGELENKNRGLEKQKAELKQSVDQLREQVQDVTTKNRQWSQVFAREKAHRQALEQRIKNCIEAMEDQRLITRREVVKVVVEHLQPQAAPA